MTIRTPVNQLVKIIEETYKPHLTHPEWDEMIQDLLLYEKMIMENFYNFGTYNVKDFETIYKNVYDTK